MKVKVIESTNFEWFEKLVNAALTEIIADENSFDVATHYYVNGEVARMVYSAIIEWDTTA